MFTSDVLRKTLCSRHNVAAKTLDNNIKLNYAKRLLVNARVTAMMRVIETMGYTAYIITVK